LETRYAFGENWKRFLARISERHIQQAVKDIQDFFGMETFSGRSFLDVGSGSGIHSAAACRLGASPVFSFDYDPISVECTREVRRREGSPSSWEVRSGSVLDEEFMKRLPTFDIVYSWGVLHHTGRMWDAIRLSADRCAPDGLLMIGIYNKKGVLSDMMKRVKRVYSRAGPIVRNLVKGVYLATVTGYGLVRLRNPLSEVRRYHEKRGMNYWTDLDDWLGGYPFEFATPDEVIEFVTSLGFNLLESEIYTSVAAVNQYLFRRNPVPAG
jgi:2-polyprenyl-6-hydroxyphenyl methylase/3-demethylubiquinone-9 3-methyltransferase